MDSFTNAGKSKLESGSGAKRTDETNPRILLHSKPSKFITDEEMAKINEEIPIGNLSQKIDRVVEVCRENMKKQLMPYYDQLKENIANSRDPGQTRFLVSVKRAMDSYLNDDIESGTAGDAYYILCYFLEVRGAVEGTTIDDGGMLQIGTITNADDYTRLTLDLRRFMFLPSARERLNAIEGILKAML